MARFEETTRVLVSPEGDEGELAVAEVAPGRHRILDHLGFVLWWWTDDLPDDAGYGWIAQTRELADGRLQVTALERDDSISKVSGAVLPVGFVASPEFDRFVDWIMSVGGAWELAAGGLFSGLIPRESSSHTVTHLSEALAAAVREWGGSPTTT